MIRNILLFISVILPFSVAATSCEETVETGEPVNVIQQRQLPESIREAADGVVQGNNRFALELYGRLRKEDGNLFLSPFSISTAFAMTYAGAEGVTESEMRDVFHFLPDGSRLHPAFGAIIRSLDTGAGFEGYRLNVANRLWGQTGFEIRPEFLETGRENYGADLAQLDFAASQEATETVNAWVEEKTLGKITDLMPPGSINVYTRLVLTNAVYFKGLWLNPFDEEETQEAEFHVDPERTVTVSMMHQKKTVGLGRAEGLQILELPYQTEDLSMLFILPDGRDGLAEVENRLSLEHLTAWMGTLAPVNADVWIPRFRIESKFSLKSTLSEMGMPSAFSEGADFAGINAEADLFIQAAVHQGYVEVNEEGTEAAAATGISVGITSVGPSFRADRPFLILIRDRVTGSILFMGRVADPSA